MVTQSSPKPNRFSRLANGSRRAAPLIAAITLGVVAAGLGWYYLKTSEREMQASLESEAERLRTEVVVPIQNIPAGTTLLPEMVAKRSVPSAYVHADVLTPEVIDGFLGRQLSVDISAGKPLLANFFVTPRKLFSEELEAGVRAVTIPVDEVSTISGMLRAGDHIDFLFIADKDGGTRADDAIVVPLLQDVVVRATGQITSEQFSELRKRPDMANSVDPYRQRSYTTVTVGLPPVDAQRLILAQKLGKIVAALRNADDRQTLNTGTNTQQLASYIDSFRPQQPVVRAATARAPAIVEYIVGGGGVKAQVQTPLAALLGAAAVPGTTVAAPPPTAY